MSIVQSNGKYVKKNFTSNDTISCSCENFCCFKSSINSLVFLAVFPDCHEGDNNLERYFVKLHVEVFMFETIGWIGRLLIQIYLGGILLDKSLVHSGSFDFIFRHVCCTSDSNDFVGPFAICTNWLDDNKVIKTYIFQSNYSDLLLKHICLCLALK